MLAAGPGKCAEARDRLAPIYGWFTEGFAFPDLVEARVLLDNLGTDVGERSSTGTDAEAAPLAAR
jgi:hypothetical protein